MSTKQTPKSCSCFQCKAAKGNMKHQMKLDERAFRHKQNQRIKFAHEDVEIATRGERYG